MIVYDKSGNRGKSKVLCSVSQWFIQQMFIEHRHVRCWCRNEENEVPTLMKLAF